MTSEENNKILDKAEDFFRATIVSKHLANLKKLGKLREFNVNPFLVNYLSYFLTGDGSAESLAKA